MAMLIHEEDIVIKILVNGSEIAETKRFDSEIDYILQSIKQKAIHLVALGCADMMSADINLRLSNSRYVKDFRQSFDACLIREEIINFTSDSLRSNLKFLKEKGYSTEIRFELNNRRKNGTPIIFCE